MKQRANVRQGPQTPEQVKAMIAHLLKSLFVCWNCQATVHGRDIRVGKDYSGVKFEGDSIVPKFQCPRCQSWDFELLDAPPEG